MESLTKGLRWRKSALKPIQITKRGRTSTIGNQEIDGGGDDGANHYYIIERGEEQLLSPTSRLFHEPSFNIYMIVIMGFKNPIDPSVVYDKLPHTLLKHPRFSSLQVVDDKNGGTMKWVPTNVNIHNHIIIPTIPQTLDSPDRFLEDYAYNLTKTSISPSKPMWDLHLLNLKTSNAQSIGIFRIHHSLGDRTSLLSLLLACTRQISYPDAVPSIPTPTDPNSGWFLSYRSGPWWWRLFMTVSMVLWLVWNMLVDFAYLFLKDTDTPLKAPAGAEFTPRRLVYRTVSLDDMKLIKNAMNLTINDVALGVTQAGLSLYLNRRYGEGKRDKGATQKKNNLPKKKIRLCSTLYINTRPSSSGIQALGDMMENKTEAKWGNSNDYMLLPFNVGIRDDPLDYIREAKATNDRKTAMHTFSIADLVLKIFSIKAASWISQKILTRTTLCFSNLAGPLEEIGLYGHAMEFLATSSYGQPHGLMINFQTYVNKMTIVLSVDENSISDPHTLLDDLEGSLELIKKAVYAKGLVTDEVDGVPQAVFT